MIARDEILRLLESRDYAALKGRLEELHPSDVVSLLDELDKDTRAFVFRLLSKDAAVAVFEMFDAEEKEELLRSLTNERIAMLLNEMSPDDRTALFEELPAKVVKKYLSLLSESEREVANMLLGYGEETAGRLMTTDYVDLKENYTVARALEHIRRTAPGKETIYYCYVIDASRVLVGLVSLRELILAPPDALISDIMNREVVSVTTDTDREEVARIVSQYDLLAVPVVDREHRLVGIITVDDVMDVIQEESTEDIHLMGGVGSDLEDYFGMGPWRKALKRLGWLVALIILEGFSSNILKTYEHSLETVVALAFFVPMLLGTGGNAGTQSATLVIRGIATGALADRETLKILGRELAAGAVIGCLLGVFATVRALLLHSDLRVGLVVGTGVAAVVTLSSMIGALLPLAAKRLRLDPAVMAGPFITTAVDILGLVTYFEIAKLVFGI